MSTHNVPPSVRTRSSHHFRRRATHDYDAYTEGLGGGEEAAIQAAQDAVVGPGQIMPGTIASAAFASTIRPVILVSGTLPTLPDPNYPVDTFVYKTDDSPPRLYKNQADVWVAAIGPDDIQANSITAGQIAAGAISTDELAVGHPGGSLENSDGSVLIDDGGITILNGRLTLQDEFGVTTADGSGFAGGWSDFVRTNLYNSSFRSGVVGAVGAGRTASLPYWTVAYTNASATYASADIAISLGATSGLATLTTDRVRVVSGGRVCVLARYSLGLAGSSVVLKVKEYGASGSLLATTTVHTGITAGTFRVRSAQLVLNDSTVDVEVVVEAARNVAGSDTVHLFAVSLASVDSLFDPSTGAHSGSALGLTTTPQSTNAIATHDPDRAYLVIGTFDFSVTVSGVGVCIGQLFVNGGAYGAQAIFQPAATGRGTTSQAWYVPAGTVSNGSFSLFASKTSAGGTAVANITHTTVVAIPIG